MNTQKLLVLLMLLSLLVGVVPSSAQDEVEVTYYITDDASYAVILLDGWAVHGSREDGLWLASSEEMLALLQSDEEEAVMPSGEYGIFVFAGSMENPDEWDAITFLTDFVNSMGDSERETEMSEPYEFENADRTYARIDATNESTDAIVLVYEIALDTWGIAVLYTAPGERDETIELGLALVDTIAYSLPLEDTIEGFFGTNYLVPAGWVGGEFEGIFDVGNSQEALDAEELEEGQYRILLMRWDGADLEDTANTLVNSGLEGDEFANEPILLTVGEQEILQVAVRSGDNLGLGGVLVMEGPEGEPDFVAIYASDPGESHLVGLTAVNMLLNGQVSAETE